MESAAPTSTKATAQRTSDTPHPTRPPPGTFGSLSLNLSNSNIGSRPMSVLSQPQSQTAPSSTTTTPASASASASISSRPQSIRDFAVALTIPDGLENECQNARHQLTPLRLRMRQELLSSAGQGTSGAAQNETSQDRALSLLREVALWTARCQQAVGGTEAYLAATRRLPSIKRIRDAIQADIDKWALASGAHELHKRQRQQAQAAVLVQITPQLPPHAGA